ncbi:sulfatase [Rubritalea spongiae]|uniref:Sulfatase n=1 Tax=Rubritalea spongiae TaxID=430797 RepID=A0ABW5E8Z1_9BACT
MKLTHLLIPLLTLVGIATANEKPNIIYLMADDQNFSSIGIYGNDEVQTPNMDKLGKDGMIFDKHYNTTAICMASRATAFTGMYEYKTGTNFEHGHMKPEIWAKSYPVLLREAGYLTAFAGKFGMDVYGLGPNGKQGMPESDFDIWGGSKGQTQYKTARNPSMAKYAKKYPHSTLSYGAFGQDVIRQAKEANKPFCLSISFKAPHKPATPDPQFDHIYKGKTFTRPANYGREHADHLSPQSKTGRQWERFEQWGYDDDYDKVMATYYQQIYAIDVALGMIRDELEKQGVADNTVIIYTSDNGFLCGAHGYGSKVLPLEESARAPLMIYDPRSPNSGKGLRTSSLTGNIDFAPTILTLAGLEIPENMDGKSLLAVLQDPKAEIHKELAFMNLYGTTPTKHLTVITKDLKYSYWWYGDKTMEPTEDLFHLGKDSLELTNLAKNPEAAPMLEEMRKKYDNALKHWVANAEEPYEKYGPLFDRSIPWQEKEIKQTKGKKK